MNVNVLKTTNVRKVGGESIESLSSIKQEALAWAAAVGSKATAASMEQQGYRLCACVAIAIQESILPKDGDASHIVWAKRIEALMEHKAAVIEELKSSVLVSYVAELGISRDVRAPKAKKGEDVIDSPQATVMRAEKRVNNYYDQRLRAAFEQRLLIKYDKTASGEIIPESAGKLQDRVKGARSGSAPATGKSHMKGTLGTLVGNIGATIPDTFSLESAKGFDDVAAAMELVVGLVTLGKIKAEDLEALALDMRELATKYGGALQAPQAEDAGETLETLETDETDESREAVAEA